jgi:hypothetical protein
MQEAKLIIAGYLAVDHNDDGIRIVVFRWYFSKVGVQ